MTLPVQLSKTLGPNGPAALRVAIAGLLGFAVASVTDLNSQLPYAPAVGWITAAAIYLMWTWALVGRMDAAATKDHAQNHERDGSRRPAHALILVASVASLAGVGFLLAATSGDKPDLAAGIIGVLSVTASWLAVHTVYTLRYAQLYYTAPEDETPAIDFNGDPPTYLDFAYVGFTIGMCYGVSDTNLTNRRIRMAVLSQAMVAYLLGTVIIAITLNLVGGLAG